MSQISASAPDDSRPCEGAPQQLCFIPLLSELFVSTGESAIRISYFKYVIFCIISCFVILCNLKRLTKDFLLSTCTRVEAEV